MNHGRAAADGSERASRGARALLAACVGLALAHGLSMRAYGPCDDEFIVWRYARNLAEGRGLVFNVDERVEGFTVPLWTLLHSLLAFVGGAPRLWSQALSILACGLCAWSLGRLWLRVAPGSRWPVAALLVAASPALALHAAYGLGTSLLAALLACWVAAYERDRAHERVAWRAAAWLGAAALLRHEAVLFALPFLTAERRRRPLLPTVLALGPCLAWSVLRWGYYGRLLPVTFGVKQLSLADDVGFGLEYLARSTAETGFGVLLVVALLGWLAPRRAAPPRNATPAHVATPARVALLGVVLHTGFVVAVGGDYMHMARFFVPTLPLLLFLAACTMRRRLSVHPRWCAALFLGALGWQALPQIQRPAWRTAHAFYEQRWDHVGRELAARWPRGERIALSPIGIVGYRSRLPVVDLLGLTHTAFLDVAPDLSISLKGHQRYDAEWVLAQRPTTVILGNGILDPAASRLVINAWERTLFEHPRFRAAYEPRVAPVEGSYPLYFFHARSAPPPPGTWAVHLDGFEAPPRPRPAASALHADSLRRRSPPSFAR